MTQHDLPQAYRILETHVENPTVRSFVLDGHLKAAPGQFVMAWLPGLDEKPFSLSSANPLMLSVARVGTFTTAMHNLIAGERIWLRGPFGSGFSLRGKTLLLICGGCGAAPMHYLAQVARRDGQVVHVVLGARESGGLFFAKQFGGLGCTVHPTTDDGSAGHKGTAVQEARRLIEEENVPADALYACGPEPMLEAAYKLAQAHHLPSQLSYEAYMRCGIGVCGSCAKGGCLVCRDGPVFSHPPHCV